MIIFCARLSIYFLYFESVIGFLLPPTKCSFATIKFLFFPTFSLSWSFKIFTEFTEPRIS